ncbi:hypothetical protein CHS0354_036297 [Potamilus streckersoni]|uniref:Uncharacterized protein n=1 Tax=Potamilus streckersoni TaxID=2493646 RepID=A0AAE0T8P6_9BIVA|nr:hypothetical protein CHS0354_036297 [Potamilus streckersoni]
MGIELDDKLYKRDPIIARDGYIPNSVIRKKFKPPTPPPSSPEKQWTLKPVPKPDRRHMPDYWEPEDYSVSSEELKNLESLEDESEKYTVPSSGRSSYERDYSRYPRRGVPNTLLLPQSPRDTYESIKPQMFAFQNINRNLESNRSLERSVRRRHTVEEKKQTSVIIVPPATVSPATVSPATVPSATEHSPTKSSPTESLADLQPKEELEKEEEESEFLRQLKQGQLTLDGEINLDIMLQELLKYFNHPDINIQQRAMEWLCIIQEKKGIPDVYREQAVAQIIEKVNTSPLSRVKMFSLEGLAFVGYERPDCITQMLINMADQNEDVQIAACEGLSHITGVRDKDALIQKLDVMGITDVYNSKDDEEQAMRLLGDKFGTVKDDYFQQRIQKWIESATPSPVINNFKADEIEHRLHKRHGSWEEIQTLLHKSHASREKHLSMYPDGGSSHTTDRLKELSFLSDEMDQNSVFDAFDPSGPNTFIEDDPTPITLGSVSELGLSRGVSLYEPKSARSQGVISGGGRSSKSKYNYRIDLMDRLVASVQPTGRFENDMPLYDIEQTPSLRGSPFDDLYRDISHVTMNKTGISLMDDRKLDTPFSKAGSTTDYDVNPLSNGTSQIDGSPLNSSVEEREVNNDASMEFGSPRIMHQFGSSPITSSADENYEENSVEIEDSPRSQESPGISGTSVQHDCQISIRSPTKAAIVVHESSEELITPKSDVSPRTQMSSQVDGKVSQLSVETCYDVKISPETVMENLRLKSEGTNLSMVGPLPTITKQDTVSHDLEVDSAISTLSIGESEPQTFTVSEIGGFSEVVTTMSHLDSQYGDDDSDFTDLEKFDIDSGMWSLTNKQQRIQTTDTEYTRKTQGYETRSAGSAFKRSTVKTQGYETGPAGSSFKRSPLTNPKVPGMYKYYDQRRLREQSGSQGSEELKKEPDLLWGEGQEESGIGIPVPQEESDIQSVAASIYSQEQSVGDAVSTQDSGISRDLSSDFSHEKRAKFVGMTSRKSSRLSPVKSVTGLETSMRQSSTDEDLAQTSTMEEFEAQKKKEGDWRQFFQLPTAMERRRMNQVKKEKAAGKLRQTHLPPISYFTENLPMLPGEAGMRLLQTIRIGEKVPIDGDHRYRVEPLPGKLAVHTRNEDAGLSNFGIIQMQWTTGVPNFQPTVSIPPSPTVVPRNSHRHGQHQLSNTKENFNRFRPSMEDLSSFLPHLMGHGQTTQSHSKNYEWEHPLPPPPEKESRTNLTNLKKDHDNYCKYYKLVKKQLHFYTSKNPEDLRLPEVVVKQADMASPKKDNVPKQKSKSNLSKSRSSVMLPPIKLGQLIKVV